MAERLLPPAEPPAHLNNGLPARVPLRLLDHSAIAIGACRLILPRTIHAVAGQEINIYFDNIVLAPRPGQYLFDVRCEVGRQLENRWCWTPGAPGVYPLQVEVRDLNDDVIALGGTEVRVAAGKRNLIEPFRLLCIGDSLTAASVYTGELIRLFNSDGVDRVTLMGTQRREGFAPENRHEGYSGWRYGSFTHKWVPDAPPGAEFNQKSSPFLFAGGDGYSLDVARYFDEFHEGRRPDVITVFLGINDLFLADEKKRHEAVESMIARAEDLVGALRASAPRALIGILTPTPPSVSQDSFGETNGTLQTRWGYRKNLWAGLVRLLQVFGDREEEKIHLVPAYVNLDCENNFPRVERPVNARNARSEWLCNNEVHPDESGYLQIADSIYGWITAQLEKCDA